MINRMSSNNPTHMQENHTPQSILEMLNKQVNLETKPKQVVESSQEVLQLTTIIIHVLSPI